MMNSASQHPAPESGARPITVAIIEDHPLFCEALARTIAARDGMSVVAEAETGRDGIDAVKKTHPRVCVLDLGLPDIEGSAVLQQVLRDDPSVRVLVLSGAWDSDTVYAMIEAGAAGFQRKTAKPNEIADAVERVAAGQTVLPPELHSGLVEQIRARRPESRTPLSERELEILKAVAEGSSAAEIASSLNLAESTVKAHLTRIYDRLGVSERAAAVAQAIRMGLIE
jgi:two-component system nitrate/nitrite response regulator NarL